MITPPSFVALDFETANRSPSSAVAVGLVRVEAGQLAAEAVELIRPWTSRFSNTRIHGIDELDIVAADDFARVWTRLEPRLYGVAFLAAHYAVFDREVLMACCSRARLPAPRLPFVCTVALARLVWGLHPAKLPHVCSRLGIELRHHDPGSDARACARIVLAAWETAEGRDAIRRMAGLPLGDAGC